MTARATFFGLSTLFGLRRRGWFIPYRYADTLPDPGASGPYAAVDDLLHRRQPAFAELLAAIDGHRAALIAIGADAPPAPRWTQDWFPRLDAAAAYALVRRERPRRIVEVGSGHSTRFLARAVADGGLPTQITAIDPAPRARLAGLPVEFIGRPLHQAGNAPFAGLGAGDMLFIDSSHVLMPGSDVDRLLGQILPRLPAGMLVHLHDIFLPEDYPAVWAWRGYNEQLGLLGFILGGGWRVEFASRYVVTRMAAVTQAGVLAELPLLPGAFESSLWLRKL